MENKPFVAGKTKENDGERYFRWYLEELKKNNYIEDFEREPEVLEILPPYSHKREKIYKQKENKLEEFNLLPKMTYTYDFKIVWTEKSLFLFTEVFEKDGYFKFGVPLFISHYRMINGEKKMVSFVDVKPHSSSVRFGGGKMSSFYTFPFVQKFLMYAYDIYINKIIPTYTGSYGINTCLFAKTFVPNRFLFQDKNPGLRKIKFRKVSLPEFISKREKKIKTILNDEKTKKEKKGQIKLL